MEGECLKDDGDASTASYIYQLRLLTDYFTYLLTEKHAAPIAAPGLPE